MNMIRSFRDAETRKLFDDEFSKRFQAIEKTARRKLMQLHRARTLADLSAIPGNWLEALKGDRAGQYSIRVNERFRICFTWADEHAGDVEIVDYH
jgi:toxin HigB-1